ncbi:MAG: hypothetical protein VXX14_04555, partial [Pseudomonadota bacterium]|nr:hypothetical protein [Pseudomonadota bacterium]
MSRNSAIPYLMFHQTLQNLSCLALAIVMAVGSFTIWSVSNATLSQVYAATPEKIGTFRYWRVYQLGSGMNKFCY